MLYSIEEFPDVFVDACLRNDEGKLMFLSAYGRDGVLMQMLSSLELGLSGGVLRIHLLDSEGKRSTVEIGDTKLLHKYAGKLPRDNLFGPLNQIWLYDKRLQQLDRANRIGYVVEHSAEAESHLEDVAWQLIKTLSPVALLEPWRAEVFDWCIAKEALKLVGDQYLNPPLGAIRAYRVSLSDHFTAFISDRVREHHLTLSA